MKAITLYDPWATFMALGFKTNETRPMRTKHRGDICIHVAQKPPELIGQQWLGKLSRAGERDWPSNLGNIIAVVEIYDVLPSEDFISGTQAATTKSMFKLGTSITISDEEFELGDYSEGRFIYRTRNLRRLKYPVPASGLQCVGWKVPFEVSRIVQAQLDGRVPRFHDISQIGKQCGACECKIDSDGCGCNPPGA